MSIRVLSKQLFRIAGLPVLAAIGASTFDSFFPGPLGFLIVLPTILGIGVWLLILFYSICATLFRKQWRQSSLKFAGLALSLPLMVLSIPLSDYIHLFIMYPHYRAIIATNPDGLSKPVKFPWGDHAVFVTDGIQLKTLIYDAGPTTKALVGHAQQDPNGDGLTNYTSHLIGNFFLQDST